MSAPLHGLLVDTATLAAHLGDPDWVTVDCRFELADPDWGRREHEAGHIPGARYAHLDLDLSSPIGPGTGRHPLPDPQALAARLGAWGVDEHAQVVVHDQGCGAFAARLWWLLRWLGHPGVALLDGGLAAWRAENRPLDREPARPRPRRFAGRADDAAWVTSEDLEADLAQGHYLVIDARTAERFRGEAEPIDPVAGHIPRAINLPLAGSLGADGRFLRPARLRQRFLAKLGGIEPERVVHTCGSGVNACHNLLAMELAGLRGSKLYAGSWSEWIRSPRRPVAVGGEGT